MAEPAAINLNTSGTILETWTPLALFYPLKGHTYIWYKHMFCSITRQSVWFVIHGIQTSKMRGGYSSISFHIGHVFTKRRRKAGVFGQTHCCQRFVLARERRKDSQLWTSESALLSRWEYTPTPLCCLSQPSNTISMLSLSGKSLKLLVLIVTVGRAL